MEALLSALRAVGEPSRLRLLAACAEGEMTVSELMAVVEQSQPRVSRHLKVLCDAGVLERNREGAAAFFRVAEDRDGTGASVARRVLDLIPRDDPGIVRDRRRIEAIRRARAETAAAYFRANAERWDRIRALHVDEYEVECAILDAVPDGVGDLLDIGTGTGRILELLSPVIARGVGVDLSCEMLGLARARIAEGEIANCRVRYADMYALPWAGPRFDAITIHQVLHYAGDPAAVIAEAARVLRPGGRIVIVDFLPHGEEELRSVHAHRRLGFADDEIAGWLAAAGLEAAEPRHLTGDPLTVGIWVAAGPTRAVRAPMEAGFAAEPMGAAS